MKNFKRKIMCFVGAFLIFNVSVKAVEIKDNFRSTIINEYGFVDNRGIKKNFYYLERISDNRVSYLLNLNDYSFIENYTGYSNLTINELSSKVNITEDKLNSISLIAYFGYGYKENTSLEWFVATQSLIWRELELNFNYTNETTDIIDTPSEIVEKMNIITNNVKNYLKKPEIDGKNIKISEGTSYFYDDELLRGYNVTESNSLAVAFFGPFNIALTLWDSKGSTTLAKKGNDWPNQFVIYENNNQNYILSSGNVYPLTINFTAESVQNTLKIKKYDAINKTCLPQSNSSLKGSVYTLYDKYDFYITDLTIDDNCNAEYIGLSNGTYYIQETQVGTNYILDSNKYYFEFKEDMTEQDLILYADVKKGQVLLELKDSKNKISESRGEANLNGGSYGLYKKDGTLIESFLIENFKYLSKRDLLIGEYYIEEISGSKGYKLDENKYYFVINEDNINDVVLISVYKEVYETKLILNNRIKIKENVDLVSSFEIYNKNKLIDTLITDESGEVSIYLPYGSYLIKQIKGLNGYRLTKDILFEVNEDTEEESNIAVYNEPFLGSLKINSYDYATGQIISNSSFKICTLDDDCFMFFETDENGSALIDNIPIGKYYLEEIKVPNGYSLNNEKIYFDINETQENVVFNLTNEQMVNVPNTLKEVKYFNLLWLLLGVIVYKKKI